MDKQTVAVIFGGCSSEYEVSLQSAASVIDHLSTVRYDIVMLGITKSGHWLQYGGTTRDIREDRWQQHPSCLPAFITPSRQFRGVFVLKDNEYRLKSIDVVFPVLHGKYGEDGSLQGLLEMAGLPYVGCDTLSSAICMDKEIAHTLVGATGIETPQSITVYAGESAEQMITKAESLGYPMFVKPARSGSSFGITKAQNRSELVQGLDLAFAHDSKVVIEQNIAGFEVGCAVLGNEAPIAGQVDEIELKGDFFNYEEKYTLATSRIHMPARIGASLANRVKSAALDIYHVLGCKGLARVDMFLTLDGRLVFNEVNTMPGFTSASRYPNMLRGAGISYSEMIDRLVQLAMLEEHHEYARS